MPNTSPSRAKKKATSAAPAADAGRTLDLDARRAERQAARDEAGETPVTITFNGKEYALPVELPAGFAIAITDGDLRGAMQPLFGAKAEEFLVGASTDDLSELMEFVNEIYGVSTGK